VAAQRMRWGQGFPGWRGLYSPSETGICLGWDTAESKAGYVACSVDGN